MPTHDTIAPLLSGSLTPTLTLAELLMRPHLILLDGKSTYGMLNAKVL